MVARRRFILAGSCLVALPPAYAQQPKTPKKIGVLHTRPPSDPRYQAFLAGLSELGYVDGKTITIDFRYASSDAELPPLAQALVRSNVDLIYAPTPPVAQAAQKATTTIPIVVSALGDPVRTGMIASFSRPGGAHGLGARSRRRSNAPLASRGADRPGGSARLRAARPHHRFRQRRASPADDGVGRRTGRRRAHRVRREHT